MGFFQRLFGARDVSGEDDPSAALTALESVEARANDDPNEARRRLREAGRRHRGSFRLGGELHDAFRAAFVALHPQAPPPPTSDVVAVPWEELGSEPSLRLLVNRVGSGRARHVLVRSDDPRTGAGAAGELEALALLEHDDRVALVVVGGLDLAVRRSFLDALSLPASLLDASEVLLTLSDEAVAAGLETRAVPA